MSQSKSIIQLINSDQMKQQFVKAMNSPKMIDRFLRLATSAVNQTPRLAECTASSIVGALLKSAQLNLEPNTVLQQCYLIPRRKKGTWECNFEIGYKGQMELARRSNEISLIEAREVREFDEFDIDYGENKLVHKPNWKGGRGPVIGYWARYRMKDDPSQASFEFMTKEEVEAHRDQYSQAKDSEYSPWNTAFDKMAKKTVIKQVLAYAPISVEDYAHAMAADATVINAELPAGYKPQSTADLLTLPVGDEQESEEMPVVEAAEAPKVLTPAKQAAAAMPPEPEQVDQVAEEKHRLDTLKRVKSRINELNFSPEKVLEKTGMPLSMLERASEIELTKAYKALQ